MALGFPKSRGTFKGGLYTGGLYMVWGLGFPTVVGTFKGFMGVRYGLRVSQN